MENKKRPMNVFVWKESIYKNGFKCSCGNTLSDDPNTGEPKDGLLLNTITNTLFCDKCKEPVCIMGEMETELPAGLHGNINDYYKNLI